MSEAPVLLAERKAEVLWLTLNRPGKANAIDTRVHTALREHLAAAARDMDVRALILSAAGERVFSAGADLKEFAHLTPEESRLRNSAEELRLTLTAVLDFPKPLVCALQGKALGAGCMLALAADEVVAASHASLALPEIELGMPTPLGAAMLAARANLSVVRRMVQQGETLSAAQALAAGLIDAVVEPGDLHDEALARARALARRAGPAYAGNKQWINRGLHSQLVEAAQAATALRQSGPKT